MAKKPRAAQYAAPDSPQSVGWTDAKTVRLATPDNPFRLESGEAIFPVDVEYETYGSNESTSSTASTPSTSSSKKNVVWICHALSGDAHVAGWDRNAQATGRVWRTRKPGWWDDMIGPGKPIDTDRYCVVCCNLLGSCYGTTGPSSLNPATGKRYGLEFPLVTVGDWVRLQAMLLDHLGIERIHTVVGGSLGGQQALEWALAFPERVRKSIVLAASARLSAQGIAFNAVGRYSILNDPNFRGGDYYGGPAPDGGLAGARMLAHITYLSDEGMHEKFGRRIQNHRPAASKFGVEFEVESYLDHQGRSFVERFDANSYLYITRAMDYYDAAAQWGGGDLVEACKRVQSDVMVVSFSSDWLYPPAQCKDLALALSRNGKAVTYVDVKSRYGHDAFLVETEPVGRLLRAALNEE